MSIKRYDPYTLNANELRQKINVNRRQINRILQNLNVTIKLEKRERKIAELIRLRTKVTILEKILIKKMV